MGAAFAAGQSCYLGAASVLLVLGRERVLLLTLLPVAAGAGAVQLWQLPAALAPVLLSATVMLAVVAAGHAIHAALRSAPEAAGTTPKLLRSLPYGLFGLAAGALAALAGADEPRSVVVLTLSMGFAEWLLYRYRSLALAALRESTSGRGFVLRAGRALAYCLSAYLAVLALGSLIAGVRPAPLLGLGAVLWTALLLQAFSLAWLPAAVTLAAAAAQASASLASLPLGPAQLSCCTAAAAVLIAAACRLLGRPTAHR